MRRPWIFLKKLLTVIILQERIVYYFMIWQVKAKTTLLRIYRII